ncbi:MAG: hypothetical protein AB8G15_13650 [Saprospiraceae bacterium]
MLFYYLCSLFSFFLIEKHNSPIPHQYELISKVEIIDLNQDGFLDTLTVFSDSGSGFGSKSCTVINGKTKEVLRLNLAGSFAEIRHRLKIPAPLLLPENKVFRTRMEAEVLPPLQSKIDPSLSWLERADRKQLSPSIEWQPLPIQIPKTYTLRQKNQYLCYFGHNHLNSKEPLKEVLRREKDIFFKTKHGVIWQRNNQYTWLFVSDASLTGGPAKLRWASIGKIEIKNNQLILELLCAPMPFKKLFAIDLKSGKVRQIKK